MEMTVPFPVPAVTVLITEVPTVMVPVKTTMPAVMVLSVPMSRLVTVFTVSVVFSGTVVVAAVAMVIPHRRWRLIAMSMIIDNGTAHDGRTNTDCYTLPAVLLF
jgi:hypothetical protein